ncbi:MAG TPA: peptidylprolyl isomerase [Burkholderiales bacterium]|nr:peptidylprolyl isomerase [Burkholderiales bacterium]
MKAILLAAALLALPVLAQDKAKPAAKAAPKDAVAMVNGQPVPASRMEFMMRQQTGRGAPDNDQMRAAMRDELINREIVMQEAQRAGLARTPEVQAQLDIARQEILVGAYLRDWVRRHPVSDADVQKEYDRFKTRTGDKEYRARHILVDSEDEAKSLVAQLKKGAKFADLANKHSKDPGNKEQNGGELDWSVPSAYDRGFADALVKLEKGRFTETPVQSRYGYHVILLEDVRPVRFPPLAELKPRIQQQITQTRVEEMVRGLRAKAKVE